MKVVFPLLALLAFAFQASAQTVYQGHVVFRTLFNSSVGNTLVQPFEGTATLVQTVTGDVSSTSVTLKLKGLQGNRTYGVHVHQWGDLSGALTTKMPGMPVQINTSLPTVPTVGTHFDVQNRGPAAHNCPPHAERHTGALGNITVPAGADPTAEFTQTISSELLDLGLDAWNNNSIIGRAIVIHENPDPCYMINATLGNWIGVGVIGIDNVAAATNNASQDALIPRDPWTFSPKANAVIYKGTTIVGNVWFWTGLDNKTHMSGFVNGLTENKEYAVEIRQYGNVLTDADIGAIFQGPETTHALPPNQNRHWGMLGNLKTNEQGTIIFNDITAGLELISLFNVTAHSIIGRSIAFHDAPETGSDGSAGSIYGFGVIGLAGANAIVPTFEPSPNSAPASAHAVIRAYYNSSIANVADVPFNGTVDFEQSYGGNVTVTVRVSGLQANKSYSLHVHQWGDLSSAIDPSTWKFRTTMNTASTVGGHFDALGRGFEAHGCKGINATRHTGDVGDIHIPAGTDPSSVTTIVLESELLDLGIRSDFKNDSIIGRAVVIHEIPDLCYIPQTPEGLGPWIGVGVIGLLNKTGNSARQDTLPQNTKANVLVLNATTKAPLGDIQLSTDSNGVIRATGAVSGFAPNTEHGMHVHVWGNEDSAASSGPHYSQFLDDFGHGLPPSQTRHWGALGNVTANGDGLIIFNNVPINADLLSLWNPAAHGIIGRILTFHAFADNGDPSSYKARSAYGLIGLANTNTAAPTIPTPPPTSSTGSESSTGSGTTAPPTSSTGTGSGTTTPPTTSSTGTGSGTTTPPTSSSSSSSGTEGNTTTTAPPTSTPAPTSAPPPSAAPHNRVNVLIMLIAMMIASMCVVA